MKTTFCFSFLGAPLQGGGKWTQLASKLGSGEENYTLKGEEFPQIYGSYVIYVLFAWITSTIRCPHISDVRTSLHPYLDAHIIVSVFVHKK